MKINELQAKLKNVQCVGVGMYTANCPAHGDSNSELTIIEHEGYSVSFICRDGCGERRVKALLGIYDEDSPRIIHSAGAILDEPYSIVENIAFHATRGEICLLQSVTDKGKSTLTRNALIALACGKPFPPVIDIANKPRRVLLLDFETSARRFSSDIKTMARNLAPDEIAKMRRNLFVMRDAWIGDEPVSLSQHLNIVFEQAADVEADIVVVDTASAAFALRNENDNAEVTREALKPLLQMARKLQVVVVVIHHIGKATTESGQLTESAYRGRGASAFGCYAASIINLNGDAQNADLITLKCAKRKDGGERYEVSMILNRESRWFKLTDLQPSAPMQTNTNYDVVFDAIKDFGQPIQRKELLVMLRGKVSITAIDRSLKQGLEDEKIERDKYGFYAVSELCQTTFEGLNGKDSKLLN